MNAKKAEFTADELSGCSHEELCACICCLRDRVKHLEEHVCVDLEARVKHLESHDVH